MLAAHTSGLYRSAHQAAARPLPIPVPRAGSSGAYPAGCDEERDARLRCVMLHRLIWLMLLIERRTPCLLEVNWRREGRSLHRPCGPSDRCNDDTTIQMTVRVCFFNLVTRRHMREQV
jgi:hypothetical protein